MRGCEVVVHLAAASDEAPFIESLVSPNVIGVYNVFEAARLENVRRVVFASTVQTVGFGLRERDTPYETTEPVRPNSLYGATKVMAEAMGRFYHDKHGLEFVALRIGGFQDYDSQWLREWGAGNIWLSPRDGARIFTLAIEKEGVGFAVVNAVSHNAREVLSLRGAREILGYEPLEDSRDFHKPNKLAQRAKHAAHLVKSAVKKG